MKTLLLTLVVVTIVCLDLGYTRKCHNSPLSLVYQTCPIGQNICFKINVKEAPSIPVKRACAATCPKSSALVKVVCCKTDKCN
uniref:Cytotoxin homolog Clbp-3 n=1 Tax=Naja atra TaxID=8656 RepID=3SOF3_NAJAT|nr:RecName: Full=Cytotoxin homolog Clbp-3; AltName: Full=Cardiotoxin-like basic protein 3; Short=CLBP3; Flags: Precursor [Naja atra]CAC85538.1 cardiotoxin-like basic protein 3 [Naja atra]